MSIRPNWGLLAEVDELLEWYENNRGNLMEVDVNKLIDEFEDKVSRLNAEIHGLKVKMGTLNPAKVCSNCGSREWIGQYCRNCGEQWKGD